MLHLFVVLLLLITSTINVDHMDANIWNVGRLKTARNKNMYNMKKVILFIFIINQDKKNQRVVLMFKIKKKIC